MEGDLAMLAAGRLGRPLPPHYDAALLARFLEAAGGDAGRAAERVAADARWRAAQGLVPGAAGAPLLFERALAADPWQAWLAAYWPFCWHGRAPGGEPVCCLRLGRVDFPGLLARVPREAMLRFHVATCLDTEARIRAAGGAAVMVYDLEGVGAELLRPDILGLLREISAVSAAHFPEQIASIQVVRAPGAVRVAWKVLSACLARGAARQGMRLLPAPPADVPELAALFGGAAATPAFLGGDCRCGPRGDCEGGCGGRIQAE